MLNKKSSNPTPPHPNSYPHLQQTFPTIPQPLTSLPPWLLCKNNKCKNNKSSVKVKVHFWGESTKQSCIYIYSLFRLNEWLYTFGLGFHCIQPLFPRMLFAVDYGCVWNFCTSVMLRTACKVTHLCHMYMSRLAWFPVKRDEGPLYDHSCWLSELPYKQNTILWIRENLNTTALIVQGTN